MKGLKGLIIILLFAFPSFSQNFLVLKDVSDSLPVPNVLIKLTEANGLTKKYLSDINGKLILDDMQFPIQIRMEHFAFYSLTDSLNGKTSKTYYLKFRNNQLSEVSVTANGIYLAKEISPFRVSIVDSSQISMGQSTNLQEALRSHVNIRISRDASLSSSTASMMGIGGNNVKILQDGIPLTGSAGQEMDLSQIPVQEISRIEIIDGPMAVEYGTNAQTGLINIISKNNFTRNSLVQLNMTEQTVENRFGATSGIHNWNLYANIPLSNRLSTSLSLTRNYFGGANGLSSARNIDWDPRTMYALNSLFEYRFNRLQLRFNNRFLDDEIENLGNSNGLIDPSAIDDKYNTIRKVHILKGTYSTDDITLDALLNYSFYQRKKTSRVYHFNTGESVLATFEGANDTTKLNTLQAKASIIKTYTDQFLIKFGFDLQTETASGDRIVDGTKATSNDAAMFILSEIKVNALLLRPGLRIDYNNRYSSPGVPSLHARYNLNKTILKASYSKGFRAPSLKEMYFEFKDINHNIVGNENLEAERSDYYEASVAQLFNNSRNENKVDLGVKAYVTTVENLITYGQSVSDPSVLTLLNVGKFKAKGISFTSNYTWKKIKGNFQAEYLTRNFYDDLSDEFHGSIAFSNTNSWIIKKDKLNFNLIYTFHGKEPVLLTNIGSATTFNEIGKTDAYHLFDSNIQYSFNNQLKTSFGVKNIFNKKYVSGVDNALHGTGSSQLLSFGRSIVLQLSYNLINKSNKQNEKN